MKLILSFIPLVLFLLSTCNGSKETGVIIERLKTNAPVKLLVGGTKNDSTKIFLYAPQKLKLTNNHPHKVGLPLAYISLTGSNIRAKTPFYIMRDSLFRLQKTNYRSGEEKSYLFYVGYNMLVHNSELDSLKSEGHFVQLKNKRKVFDIGGLKESAHFFKAKVADSLKGFIHFNFYNFKTELLFVENVPIAF